VSNKLRFGYNTFEADIRLGTYVSITLTRIEMILLCVMCLPSVQRVQQASRDGDGSEALGLAKGEEFEPPCEAIALWHDSMAQCVLALSEDYGRTATRKTAMVGVGVPGVQKGWRMRGPRPSFQRRVNGSHKDAMVLD
jgi:hypothetical protein